MTRKFITAVAIGAIACGVSVSSASAKHHVKHHVYAHAEAAPAMKSADYPAIYNPSGVNSPSELFSSGNRSSEQIQGVNPMTNSPAIPAAPNKQPYVAIPGVNPM
jgi:hypothetical protein